jgi:hypothetical protein
MIGRKKTARGNEKQDNVFWADFLGLSQSVFIQLVMNLRGNLRTIA